MFRDYSCCSLDRAFIVCDQRVGSWAVYWRQAGIRWYVVFLPRIANHLRSKLTIFLLIVLLKYNLLRLVSEWYKVYHPFRGSWNGCGRIKFLIYDGDGISEWCEVIILFRGKVASVHLLTDRNDVYQYSSNIGVPYLLLPAWMEFSSGIGIIRSGKVVSSRFWQTRKPNSFWRGHLVFLAGVG